VRIGSRSSVTWEVDGWTLAQYGDEPLEAYAVRREPTSRKVPTTPR
jgi:hypothetical protein